MDTTDDHPGGVVLERLPARSPQTRRLYARDWAHFTGWCRLLGRDPLPAQVETVRWYLTDLEATLDPDGQPRYA